jgi:hypothetical protein
MERKPNRLVSEEEMTFFNESYNTRKKFIEAASALWKPFISLAMAWENLSHEDNGETSVNCPFPLSFDEWIAEYFDWLSAMTEKFETQTTNFNPTVTVKDLKQILSVLEDDVQIVISDQKNDWWINVKEVELPSEGIFTLVLHPTDDFDNRQF